MKTVLVIEDDLNVRMVVARILQTEYNIIMVGNKTEGRQVIVDRQADIDLVLTDIDLGDGFSPDLHKETLPILEAHRIRWLAMSGGPMPEHADYYRNSNVRILPKPIGVDHLLKAVAQAFDAP